MILKTMIQTNRTLYWGAGIYIMDGNEFYYEARTKVNVYIQEQRQVKLLNQFLLPFIASGETPTRRTVTLEERCSFLLHRDKNYAFFFQFGFLSICTLDLDWKDSK